MGLKGNKDNPCLLGEFIRVIKDNLFLSNYDMLYALKVQNVSTISAWITSKQEPSSKNCSEIIKLFKTTIINFTLEDTNRLFAYLKYCIAKSNINESIKNEILKIGDLGELIGTVLIKTKAFNTFPGRPFDDINTISQDELESYDLDIKKERVEEKSNETDKNSWMLKTSYFEINMNSLHDLEVEYKMNDVETILVVRKR